jgi:hypothetical protein
MFKRYATGDESDRTTAEWLNAKGAKTARGRRFQADTVREMLVNASYCGYVTGLRDQSREIRGRHEPIVPEELFDRVQQIRSWRSRVVGSTGRPSEDYLLRKLLYCERCNGRTQGTRGSRAQLRRYQCGTRRRGGGCDQAIVKAEPLEDQLVDGLRDFRPDSDLLPARHRRDLGRGQSARGRRARPPPRTARTAPTAPRPLRDGRPHERPLHRVWQDDGVIVAVRSRAPFARYFAIVADIQAISEIPETPAGKPGCRRRERRDSDERFALGRDSGVRRRSGLATPANRAHDPGRERSD